MGTETDVENRLHLDILFSDVVAAYNRPTTYSYRFLIQLVVLVLRSLQHNPAICVCGNVYGMNCVIEV